MSLFQSVLKSISEKIKEKSSFKETVVIEINNVIKANIKTDQIKIKDGKIFINTHPTIKSVIFLKKEEILKKLKEKGINIFSIN